MQASSTWKRRAVRGALGVVGVAAGLPVALGATPVSAANGDIKVTEVSSRASSTPLGDDWIELTNTGSAAVDLTGWRVDDDSNSFGGAGLVTGVTSIAPGESVVLITEATSTAVNAFASAWFNGSAPAGLQIGWINGSGLGLGSGGDQINVFNAAGTRVANVSFGSAGSATPAPSFDNRAGATGAITTFSQVGVNGAFVSSNGAEVGSPGIADGGTTPPPPTTTLPPTTTTPPPASALRVTEVSARGNDTALGDDWIELTNVGSSAVDISGWRVDDSSNSFGSAGTIGGVTSIAPGESVILVTEATATAVTAFATQWFAGTVPAGLQIGWIAGSGLGLSNNGDAINVFDASGTVVASVTFGAAAGGAPAATFDNAAGVDAAAITTYSQLGVNGAFVSANGAELGSPGAATLSGGPTGPTFTAWPGSPDVRPIENYDFGEDMSGLDYEGSGTSAPGVLWAARNKAGTLFRLVFDGANWVPDTANGWGAGKDLRYPGGVGHPDSEGLTYAGASAAGGIYIASERDNDNSGVSRNAVLRYDVTAAGSTLTAAQQWDLTADLPATGANLGLEAITWISDAQLVAKGFLDESKDHAYNPAEYPNHGDGVFLVALEATGGIYAYVLKDDGTFTRVATIASDLTIVTDLQYDVDTQRLWAECDNTCNGRLTILEVAHETGKFAVTAHHERPTGLADNNNEGFAIAPAAYCVDGFKPVYWSDDGATGGVSIVEGALACDGGPGPVVPEFPLPVLALISSGAVIGGWFALRRRWMVQPA